MKTQIVKQRILTADDGMFLTDGETYGKTVVLAYRLRKAKLRFMPHRTGIDG